VLFYVKHDSDGFTMPFIVKFDPAVKFICVKFALNYSAAPKESNTVKV
jgi:hypothetical protein